jgi:hypothetical protein
MTRALLVLLAALLLPGVAQAGPGAPYGVEGWGFLTGGAGGMLGARKLHPMGRLSVGIGGNLIVVYGSLSVEHTLSAHQDFVLMGVASAGFVIPIPAFKLMLGFKGGGGLQLDTEYGPSPAVSLGPQLGIHIGKIGGNRFGIRLMVEPAVTIVTKHRIGAVEIVGTIGVLF